MSTINISHYLYVFNHLLDKGVNREGKRHCGELSVWHDMDGYTCYIGYKDLTMSLYFHNRFAYDYQDESTLKAFMLLIDNTFKKLSVR
ncbi:DUF3081 family protein [Colwellia sp. 12G3]|uniref:DUF3081 family protein n=1 Tax=Colwellia sp. 12G3 TaxID=2058299 RepID=UPI000C341EA8|nr:DUF3081 family protein [Colwellia sp. 12G3]PKI17332.1 DUF3081 domain-containing protein [Colwellia sp. 12G3]